MSVASPGAKTQKLPPIPSAALPTEVTSRISLRPVFVDDGGRRKRVLVRAGYLAAAACIAYLIVVGVSLTAGPAGPLSGLAGPLAGVTPPVVAPEPAKQPPRETAVRTAAPAVAVEPPPRRSAEPPLPTPAAAVPLPTPARPTLAATSAAPTSSVAPTRTRRGRTPPPEPAPEPGPIDPTAPTDDPTVPR